MCKISFGSDFGFAIGSSMIPTFGTINLISITEKQHYLVGEIISFKGHDGKYYAHRITSIDEKLFTTKGDNQSIQDYETHVPIKNIRGIVKVIWRIKK